MATFCRVAAGLMILTLLVGCAHSPMSEPSLPGLTQAPAPCPQRSEQVSEAIMAAASLAVEAVSAASPGSWPGLRRLAKDGRVQPGLFNEIMSLAAVPGKIRVISALSKPPLLCQMRADIADLRATLIASELDLDPETEKEYLARIEAYGRIVDLLEAAEKKPDSADYGLIVNKIESFQSEWTPERIVQRRRELEAADLDLCERKATTIVDCTELRDSIEKRDAEIERRRSAKEAQAYMAENFTRDKDGTLRRKTAWEKLLPDPRP